MYIICIVVNVHAYTCLYIIIYIIIYTFHCFFRVFITLFFFGIFLLNEPFYFYARQPLHNSTNRRSCTYLNGYVCLCTGVCICMCTCIHINHLSKCEFKYIYIRNIKYFHSHYDIKVDISIFSFIFSILICNKHFYILNHLNCTFTLHKYNHIFYKHICICLYIMYILVCI